MTTREPPSMLRRTLAVGASVLLCLSCQVPDTDSVEVSAAAVESSSAPELPIAANAPDPNNVRHNNAPVDLDAPGLEPPNSASAAVQELVDASRDALFAGPNAALPVDLLAHIQDAPYLGVVDVTAVRERWESSGFAAFALHVNVDPLLQRLAAAAGARLVEPALVTALAASYDPSTQDVTLAVLGSLLENVGAAEIIREGPVSVARSGGRRGGPLATVALGTGLPPSAIAVLRAAPDESLPQLLSDGFRVGWASDDTVWVDLDANASVDGWIGRGQAFASQTLGQLRTSAPPELQAGVTLLTRWQEALWARLRVQTEDGVTRLGLPAPRCGGVSRNAFAGALLLGWMDAAANDESLELRPRVPMSALLQTTCDRQQTTSSLPRHLALLGDGQTGDGSGAQLVLGDATALVRAMAPSAGGLLPFALPRDVVAASLGSRPLGVDSLDHPAPVAWVSQGTSRAMVLPVGTANALGPNTLLEGGVPQLLSGEGVLISRAGSGFNVRLEEADSRWRDAAQLMPGSAALAFMWAPSSPWHETEVLGLAWTPGRSLVLTGAPASQQWSVEVLSERIVAVARGGMPGGVLSAEQAGRLGQVLESVELRNSGGGWRAEISDLGPWVPIAIELGLAAWGASVERGPIQFPITGPLSPGLQFTQPPPTTARP
ncbi:MAG: hypothetical protein ACI81R_001434 [Bradymonadia bacterium]|jgi:hypothetical protein